MKVIHVPHKLHVSLEAKSNLDTLGPGQLILVLFHEGKNQSNQTKKANEIHTRPPRKWPRGELCVLVSLEDAICIHLVKLDMRLGLNGDASHRCHH